MRKKRKTFFKSLKQAYFLLGCMFVSLGITAQNSQQTVTGAVYDHLGDPAIGASIMLRGSTTGTMTDIDGNFSISAPADGILEVSYIGYVTQSVSINGKSNIRIDLKVDQNIMLDEVVAIGYGSVKKSDLTGAITAIGEKDFNKGVVSSPAELLTGRVAGVQIISNGGRAGSGAEIKIRSGASLDASNNPLIVIDGVSVSPDNVSGSTDILSTINPNDIESMSILKDASATAIYGSRASNGVIIITTKKGAKGQGLKVNISSQNSISTIARKIDVLGANEFRELVANNPFSQSKFTEMLGEANTDWQDEIFRNAFTTDNNVSISGAVNNVLPFRVSAGFMSQDGILKTDNMKRGTAAVSLSPSLLNDHLKIDLNVKGTYSKHRFGNGDAIGAALRMDPTKPVTSDAPEFEPYNGYWTWFEPGTSTINTLATRNPVALLESRDDTSDVLRSIGNIQFDYKMHFLPDLRANLNLGYDVAQGKGDNIIKPWGPSNFGEKGSHSKFKQEKRNLLFEFYLNYTKEIESIRSRFDIMAGHTYQDWKSTDHKYDRTNFEGTEILTPKGEFDKVGWQSTLISFYGRLNYSLMDRYLLTATIRRDASSRFGPDTRWGTFPSVALAWRISDESFMQDFDQLSNLKLRLGYGLTGQQEIGNYEYIARYNVSDPTAYYQIGDTFYPLWRPEGYDRDRKWEETATKNIGVDFGFFNNRLYGSFEYYYKKTNDLLNNIDLPIGSNFTNQMVTNIGSITNRGIEASLGIVAIDKKDMYWDINFNVTYSRSKITQLSLNDGSNSSYIGRPVGDISGGTGNKIQMHSVGHVPSAFYVYKQLYNEEGRPVEGAYADLNGDGVINEEDRYFYKSSNPDIFMGFNTTFNYKRWTLATSLRASIGNYIYNNVNSDLGIYGNVLNTNNFLMNTVEDIYNSNFNTTNFYSDYYIQNASFLKMDNIALTYDLGKIARNVDLKVNFMVQNVFTITDYKGIDPEIPGGIDNNFYPNPRSFTLGLNLNF